MRRGTTEQVEGGRLRQELQEGTKQTASRLQSRTPPPLPPKPIEVRNDPKTNLEGEEA